MSIFFIELRNLLLQYCAISGNEKYAGHRERRVSYALQKTRVCYKRDSLFDAADSLSHWSTRLLIAHSTDYPIYPVPLQSSSS